MALGQVEGLIASGILYMIQSGFSSKAAAQAVAAQYDYFQQLNEAQLGAVAFNLARAYPSIPYWEWMGLLKRLQDYGLMASQSPTVDMPPATDLLPYSPASKASITGDLLIVGVIMAGVLLVYYAL